MNRSPLRRPGGPAALLAGAVTLVAVAFAFVVPAAAGTLPGSGVGPIAVPTELPSTTDPAPADRSPTESVPTDPSPTGSAPTDPEPIEQEYVFCPVADEPSVHAMVRPHGTSLTAHAFRADEIVCFEGKVKVEIKDGKPYVTVVPVPNGPTIEGKAVEPTKLEVGGFTKDFDKGKATIQIVVTCTKGGNSTKYDVKVDVEWVQPNNPKSDTTITKAK